MEQTVFICISIVLLVICLKYIFNRHIEWYKERSAELECSSIAEIRNSDIKLNQ